MFLIFREMCIFPNDKLVSHDKMSILEFNRDVRVIPG